MRSSVSKYAITIASAALFTPAITAAQDEASKLPETTDAVLIVSAEEALAIDGKAYAARYGVSLEEAMRRILIMASTSEQVAALESEFSEQVSGIYFDNSGAFQLIVQLTEKEQRAARRLERKAVRTELRGALSDARQEARDLGLRGQDRTQFVNSAEKELAATMIAADISAPIVFKPNARKSKKDVRKAMERQFEAIQARFDNLEGILYDEVEGTVVVRLIGRDTLMTSVAQQELQSLFEVPVRVELVPNRMQDTVLRGGLAMETRAGEPGCTTGFVGWAPPKPGESHSTEFGIFTAGHCRTYAEAFRDASGRQHTLTVHPSLNLDNNNGDIAFWIAPVGLSAQPQFYANKNEAARTLTGRRTRASTTGTVTNLGQNSTATSGTFVCFYGRKTGPVTGQACGEVTYNGFQYNSASAGYLVEIEGDFACFGGDSGAPVFAYTIAFGIENGCRVVSTTVVQNNTMHYTSMDLAYDRGFRLSY